MLYIPQKRGDQSDEKLGERVIKIYKTLSHDEIAKLLDYELQSTDGRMLVTGWCLGHYYHDPANMSTVCGARRVREGVHAGCRDRASTFLDCHDLEFQPEDASEVWTDLQTSHANGRSLPSAVDQALSQHDVELNDIAENLNTVNKESARQKRRRRRHLLALVEANQRKQANQRKRAPGVDDEETVVDDEKSRVE